MGLQSSLVNQPMRRKIDHVLHPAPSETATQGIMVRVFANGLGDWGSTASRVIPKILKMELDASLLNSQHHRVQIKGWWSNSGKGVAPFPKPRCSSYLKRSLKVAFDYGRPTYIYIYIYIYI